LVVSALGAAAVAIAKGALSEAGKQAYLKLKGMVRERFGGDAVGLASLEEYERDPAGWEAALQSRLVATGAADDLVLQQESRRVLQIVQADIVRQSAYNVTIEGYVKGAIFGDNAEQHNTFTN
jgi:hypothetical protein